MGVVLINMLLLPIWLLFLPLAMLGGMIGNPEGFRETWQPVLQNLLSLSSAEILEMLREFFTGIFQL